MHHETEKKACASFITISTSLNNEAGINPKNYRWRYYIITWYYIYRFFKTKIKFRKENTGNSTYPWGIPDIFMSQGTQGNCSLQIKDLTLRSDKVSMLMYTCSHKPLRKNSCSCAIPRLTAHFMCGLMSDLVVCKPWKEYGHTCHWMSLLRPCVIKQHKPNRRDKVNMLTYTCSNPWAVGKIAVYILQSPGWQPTLIWWFANIEKGMVIHDTECPCWDKVSLNNANPTQIRWCMARRLGILNNSKGAQDCQKLSLNQPHKKITYFTDSPVQVWHCHTKLRTD